MTRNDILIKKTMKKILFSCLLITAVTQICSICDNIFSSRFLGIEALAAVQLGTIIHYIVINTGNILGTAGNALAGIMLGKRQIKEAGQVFTFTLLIGALISVLFIIAAFTLSPTITRFLSGDKPITEGLVQYVKLSMLGAPIFCIGRQLVFYSSTDNHVKLSVLYPIIMIILKLFSEYLFLVIFHLGVEYVQLSTIIGYGFGLIAYIPYILSSKRMLHITNYFTNVKVIINKLFEYIKPNLIFYIGINLSDLLIKMFLIRMGGDNALALYAIAVTVESVAVWMIAVAPINMFGYMGGVLYGENDVFGLKTLIKKVAILSLGIVSTISIFFCFFPMLFLQLFGLATENVPHIYIITVRCASLYSIALMLYLIVRQYAITTGRNKSAALLSFLKEYVYNLVLEILLSLLAHALGFDIFYGFLIALCLSPLLTLLHFTLYIKLMQKKREPRVLPQDDNSKILDISILDIPNELPTLIDTVKSFCISADLDNKWINFITLASEEAVNAIREANKPKHCYIDINLHVSEKKIYLKIRSDGVTFDPSVYVPAPGEISSLFMLQKLASNIHYLRIMYLNSTVYTFNL